MSQTIYIPAHNNVYTASSLHFPAPEESDCHHPESGKTLSQGIDSPPVSFPSHTFFPKPKRHHTSPRAHLHIQKKDASSLPILRHHTQKLSTTFATGAQRRTPPAFHCLRTHSIYRPVPGAAPIDLCDKISSAALYTNRWLTGRHPETSCHHPQIPGKSLLFHAAHCDQ